MAEALKPAGSAASAAGRLYPVDIKEEKPEVLEAAAQEYYAKLLEQPATAAEYFSIPGRGKVKLEASLVCFLPLYGQDSKRRLLVLNDPQQKTTGWRQDTVRSSVPLDTSGNVTLRNRINAGLREMSVSPGDVLAVYLHNSWWPIEDIVKTADLSREGLIQVQTFEERIVLFVLNCIIFGRQEGSLMSDVVFMPHPEEEQAKIFWKNREAAAFYTVKAKGSLCGGHSSQCYLLPVLDTVFVQKRFRRCGLGTGMLQDFCETFATEEALGISSPISAEMYQVCQRFLDDHPEEQSRLWEVEAPGGWSQRTSVWLTIQLARNLPQKACPDS